MIAMNYKFTYKRKEVFTLLIFTLIFNLFESKCQLIGTVGGDGIGRFAGDGGAATSGSFWGPRGVAVNATQDIYVCDYHNQRIRKITNSTGNISTVAGTGTMGYTGDGAAATCGNISGPNLIAVASNGDVYWTELNNYIIRYLDVSTGFVETAAGTGAWGVDRSGAATSANIGSIFGLAFDSAGDLFISDQTDQCIKKVDMGTGVLSVYAGTCGFGGYTGDGAAATAATLGTPTGLSFDDSDNLYITERANYTIRKVTKATGVISTVAGTGVAGYTGDGGAATAATMNEPRDVVVDGGGNLYIADHTDHVIRYVDAATGAITTYAGTNAPGYSGDGGAASAAQVNGPWGVDINPVTGALVIGDLFNERVRSEVAVAVLPVELLYFKATPGDNQVVLQWETAMEINNESFEVQRSNDGNTWEVFSVVNGAGTSYSPTHYDEVDERWDNRESMYYRLKQVDYSGNFSHSTVQFVDFNENRNVLELFPNPTSGLLRFSISEYDGSETTFVIYDSLGKIVKTGDIDADASGKYFSLDLSDLSQGTYHFKVVSERKLIAETFNVQR